MTCQDNFRADVTGHLVACRDILDTAAGEANLSTEDFNTMRAMIAAAEIAFEAAELTVAGRPEEAGQRLKWALWKIAEQSGDLSKLAA